MRNMTETVAFRKYLYLFERQIPVYKVTVNKNISKIEWFKNNSYFVNSNILYIFR